MDTTLLAWLIFMPIIVLTPIACAVIWWCERDAVRTERERQAYHRPSKDEDWQEVIYDLRRSSSYPATKPE